MPLKIKTAKFRHVFGQSTRKDGCYENIRITKNAHDSNFCAVNPKFLAVVLESVGGGAFLVLPLKQVGLLPFTIFTYYQLVSIQLCGANSKIICCCGN